MGDWFLGFMGFFPLVLYAAWHASRQPDERWVAIGENKTAWIVFMIGGYFIAGIGFLAALWYLASLRRELEKADTQAAPHARPL